MLVRLKRAREPQLTGLGTGISSDEFTLLQIVKGLGPFLTSDTGSSLEDGTSTHSVALQTSLNQPNPRYYAAFKHPRALSFGQDQQAIKYVQDLALSVKVPFDSSSGRVLVTFYNDKLNDAQTVIPALGGLLALSSLPTFLSSDGVEVFKAYVPIPPPDLGF